MSNYTLLVLVLVGTMSHQHASADAGSELALAMENREASLRLDIGTQLARETHARELSPAQTKAFTSTYRQQVFQLDRSKMKSLRLDDPLLIAAYMELFLTNFCGTRAEPMPAWHSAVYSDLQQRGNAATPLLLKLLAAAPGPQFGEELFFKIDGFSTMSLAPYLAAARVYLQAPPPSTTERTWRAISYFVSRRGNAHDLDLLEEVRKHLPFGKSVSISPSDIERMRKRLNGTLQASEWHGQPPEGYDLPSGPKRTKEK